jgi:hypothetical protein
VVWMDRATVAQIGQAADAPLSVSDNADSYFILIRNRTNPQARAR